LYFPAAGKPLQGFGQQADRNKAAFAPDYALKPEKGCRLQGRE